MNSETKSNRCKHSRINTVLLSIGIILLILLFLLGYLHIRNSKALPTSTTVKNGLSAYELAVENGYTGTVQEWLDSLKGKSAYQIAVDSGFKGTEKEWTESLQAKSNGKKSGIKSASFSKNGELLITLDDNSVLNLGVAVGKNGIDGLNGLNGKDGADGTNGSNGIDGKDGTNGSNGRDGIDGKDGINGLNGTDGKDGLNGQDGLNGKDGKDGSDGVGISSVNINSSNELVLVLSDNSEINLGNIKGKDGENGKNGKDGADGVGIKTVTLSTDGNLSIVLTNNTTVELGNIKGEKGNSIKSARINTVGELMITLSDNSELNAGKVTGSNGSDGKGIDTVSLVDGNLTITLTDGTVNNLGNISGKDGTNGLNGKDGKDGRGIVKTEIVNGELIITYTDNTTENAGKVIDDTTGSDGLDFYPLPDGTFGVAAGKTKYLENIVIPETHNGKQVTEILENAFQNSTNLKSITIPANIQTIGAHAFDGCKNLKDIILTDPTGFSKEYTYHENNTSNGKIVTAYYTLEDSKKAAKALTGEVKILDWKQPGLSGSTQYNYYYWYKEEWTKNN